MNLHAAKPIFIVVGLIFIGLAAFKVGASRVDFGWLGVLILGIGFWIT